MYNIEAQFLQKLERSGINSLSLKNYRSDIHFFGKFIKENYLRDTTSSVSDREFSQAITPTVLSRYQTLLRSSYKGTTVNRKLTTLRKFLRFLGNRHVIPTALVEEISLVETIGKKQNYTITYENAKQRVIANYNEHLTSKKIAPNSKSCYKSDIEQFLTWVIDK